MSPFPLLVLQTPITSQQQLPSQLVLALHQLLVIPLQHVIVLPFVFVPPLGIFDQLVAAFLPPPFVAQAQLLAWLDLLILNLLLDGTL